jgi:hypothetical protein
MIAGHIIHNMKKGEDDGHDAGSSRLQESGGLPHSDERREATPRYTRGSGRKNDKKERNNQGKIAPQRHTSENEVEKSGISLLPMHTLWAHIHTGVEYMHKFRMFCRHMHI